MLYDDNRQITAALDLLQPGDGHIASYDALSRLVQSSGWYGVYRVSYDANGNRTAITRAGSTDNYGISTSNNYLSKTGLVSYSHDATGNLIKRGNDTFTYDGYGQLVSATVGGKSAVYRYNVSGQRVTKTVDGETTVYLYDTDGRLLAEAVSGVVTREYLWLGAKPVAYVTGGQVYNL